MITTLTPRPGGSDRKDVARVKSLRRTSVIVVGGGINGLATFRDLAMQGVDVVLVERADFASGATAASSHMIHGGLRYLENGELRLVRESVQERNSLLRLAPHYVSPLRTTIPIFSTFSGLLAAPVRILRHSPGIRARARGALLIKIGLVLYDTFSRDNGAVPRHEFLGRRKSLELLPKLRSDVKYTATYYDAVVHSPERLALDVLFDGLDAHHGAHAVNYVEAIGLDDSGVRLRDLLSGDDFTLSADVVVNASGPWTDLTNEAFGKPTAYMGGSKGSHIVLDHPALLEATGGREIFFENADGRIVLVHPLHNRVLVGTTDLDADPRESAVCTEEEVDYFFDLITQIFPDIEVDRADIVFRYAGIRPLPHHGAVSLGMVSRDYRIEVDATRPERVVLSLVGGKWTTFRALGESLADRVLELLGRGRVRSTSHEPIGGGRGFPGSAQEKDQWIAQNLPDIDLARGRTLLARYGTRAADLVPFIDAGTDRPLVDGELSTGEVSYLVARERVSRINDIVLRRTTLAFTGAVSTSHLGEIATALAAELGWDPSRTNAELTVAAIELQRLHGGARDDSFNNASRPQ